MILVGLTGGIGAGKSTVSAMLAERGAVIVDGDQVARDLQAPGTEVLARMAERFGSHIIRDDGSLDRPAVAAIVFNDADALADLNGIVHPAMQAEIDRQVGEHRHSDRVVVLDFPLLAEKPREGLDATIVVDLDPEIAVERLVSQRGMDEADARARIASQASRQTRLSMATHVIDNSSDEAALRSQVDDLWDELTSELSSGATSEPTSRESDPAAENA